MKTEFKVLDMDGHIIHDNEIQLSHIGNEKCKERIMTITQDGILKISLKFKLEDGKIVNPELMKIICDGSGQIIGNEYSENIKPEEHAVETNFDLEEYKQKILSDFAVWLDSEDWQAMLEAYNNGEEE